MVRDTYNGAVSAADSRGGESGGGSQRQETMPPRKPKGGPKRRRAKERRAEPAPIPPLRELSPHAAGYAIVHDMAKALTSTLQLDQVLKTIMEKVQELMAPDTWSLLLVDEVTSELYFQIATGKGRTS